MRAVVNKLTSPLAACHLFPLFWLAPLHSNYVHIRYVRNMSTQFLACPFSRAKMSHDQSIMPLLLDPPLRRSLLSQIKQSQNQQSDSKQTTQDPIMKLSQVAKNIAQGTKDLAVASAGVSPYGVVVDGAVKSPISNAVEVVDEVAEASRGVNSYGTNVDHRLGHELEKH